jgi:hypothetical protein
VSRRAWPDRDSLDSRVEGVALLHTCDDGHSWTQQPDGGVSPSWGYGLTSVKYKGWDPALCPEPIRNPDRTYTCVGCGGDFYTGHGTPGVMCDPWNFDKRCKPPEPACGKPAVETRVWVAGERGKGGGWVDATPRQLTIDDLIGVAA